MTVGGPSWSEVPYEDVSDQFRCVLQIVVDNEVTASELLQKGKLTKRVTIIPLNKASDRPSFGLMLLLLLFPADQPS